MRVFHGGYTEIFDIDLSKCQSNKDFGRGFYVTKYRKHAETWAVNMARRCGREPFVTEFTFYERAFEESRYKTLRFDDYNEAWLDFIVLNRDPAHTINRHDYDVVEGPIADDKVQNRINEFLDEIITKDAFLEELKYHEQTHQICFCSLNSLQLLKKTEVKYASFVVKITEPLLEQLMLDHNMDEQQSANLFYKSKTFALLADEGTKLYQKTWHEIYAMLKLEIETRPTSP